MTRSDGVGVTGSYAEIIDKDLSFTPVKTDQAIDCQFLQRQKILGIYREMMRTIRQVPEEGDRKYLRDWAREEFKKNKTVSNQVRIKLM